MLRFRLGPIPVEVHPSHFVYSGLLAFVSVQGGGAASARSPFVTAGPFLSTALFVASWVALIFVSVLVHELGHALAARAFGWSPRIALVGLGGVTQAQPADGAPLPWLKDVGYTLAGPCAGLALGIACGVAAPSPDEAPLAAFFLRSAALANLAWAVLNLLPVPPLDGGRISRAVLVRLFGNPGEALAQGVGLLFSIGMVLWSIRSGSMLTAVLFGFFAVRSVTSIAAYFRGEDRPAADADVGAAAVRRAQALLLAGRRAEARVELEPLLDQELTVGERSSVHHLLGTIALREGQGRLALDHFSQVQRQRVETRALAEAFSLVGDEARAITFWELAYRETRDPGILHDYAGALIRAGREAEARRLDGIDLARAYRAAERLGGPPDLRGEGPRESPLS